ncbi:MAG: hypothetical protein J6W64_03830 [Bacilli bacterium]|nr:hypothetical protein [Bacilli bacterium]
MKKKVVRVIMNKVLNIVIAFFKAIYSCLDKFIITPISRLIYSINERFKGKSYLSKLINRPKFLVYASLFLAVIMFILIDSKVINLVENDAEVITNIPVTVKYNEEAYVVEGVPKTVDMVLTGRKSDIYLAKQLGEHEVILDLTDYESISMSHKVKLTYTKSVSSLSYKLNPGYVTVTIKDKVSTLATVNYELLNLNKLNSKLSVESVELNKSEVVVKGSKDVLNEIASVKALIDLNNNDFKDAGTYEIENVPLVAYDSKGKIIEEVEIVPSSLNATVKLDTYSVSVPISVQTTGKLVTGKAISKILINNSESYSIEIYGDKESISEIKSVPVTVNVAGQGSNDSKSYTVSLSKPQGVKHMSADTATINLSFADEKQRTIEISAENVAPRNLANGLTANAKSKNTISVQVKGVQSVIDSIKPEDINAYIDLSKYTAGDYDIDVKIENNDPRLTFVVNNTIGIKISNS